MKRTFHLLCLSDELMQELLVAATMALGDDGSVRWARSARRGGDERPLSSVHGRTAGGDHESAKRRKGHGSRRCQAQFSKNPLLMQGEQVEKKHPVGVIRNTEETKQIATAPKR